ncbi:MAG: sulfatase [Kofleriaceae bacterium]
MASSEHFARRAWRRIAPSVVAASAGGLACGLADTIYGDGTLGIDSVAATGFVLVLAFPALLALALVARATWAAWRPSDLAARFTEPGGGMPRLGAWIATAFLGTAVFAWIVFRGTWLLVSWTKFKPNVVSLAQPMIAVAGALVLLLLAPLAVTVLAAIARRLDGVWQRRGHATLLTPRKMFVAGGILAAAAIVVVWHVVISPRIGTLAIGVLIAPAIGGLVATVTHARFVRAPSIAIGVVSLAALCIAFALVTAIWRPASALGVWGDQPIAGVVVERVFSLDRIRGALPLDDYRPVARPGQRPRDVVVVLIDTLRADRTPPYGGTAEMPVLAALGERGAVFHWAFSPSNVTRRSVPTMLTGTSPDRVRGRVVGWGLRLDPRHILVAERLRAAGYDTAGFVCCGGLYGEDLRTGFDRGLATLEIDESAMHLGAKAGRFVTARAERGDKRPLFMWLHFLEPHNWAVNTPVASTMGEQYDRSLTLVDRALVPLIAAFANRPPDQAPIIIVTSDHGEGLGEHGARNHSTDLYNSQIRVPLVIAGPTVAAVRPTQTVALVDLVPTIIDLAGFVPPTGRSIDGQSLAPLARGEQVTTRDTAFAAMIADRSNPGGVTVIVDGAWKLVETGGIRELYNIHQDPGERTNLAAKHPEIVARLVVLLATQRVRAQLSAFE